VILATFAILAAAAAGFGYRLWIGPSLADRAIALNGLILVGMGAIAAQSIQSRNGAFLPTLVALALVGSISTGMVARFIESGGRDG
jgi:multisubunit Na+/H+ antiporter MnhF subunit